MAFTKVQEKTYASPANATDSSVVFDTTPTQGSLLVACANADSTRSMSSSGWTLVESHVSETGLYMWAKIAGASESVTVTITGSSASAELWAAEYATPLSATLAEVVDQNSDNETTSGSTTNPGTTGTTTQADELAVVCVGVNFLPDPGTINSWSDGFGETAELTGVGSVNTKLGVGEKLLTEVSTQTCTITFSTSSSSDKGACIVTFKASDVELRQIRPDADTDVTGWSTAPIFSKVNDSSDATVVTATLA